MAEYALGVLTFPLLAIFAILLGKLLLAIRKWWTKPGDLSNISRDRRVHVTAIVASEMCAARRMWHIKLPGNVLLVIRSGGVGRDSYGWVLLDRRMEAFRNGINRAFDELDAEEVDQ